MKYQLKLLTFKCLNVLAILWISKLYEAFWTLWWYIAYYTQATDRGNVVAEDIGAFNFKKMTINIAYDHLKDVLKKDMDRRSQTDKDHDKKQTLGVYCLCLMSLYL